MDAVAQSLSDPIRREILRMLRRGPALAGEIAGHFDVSRPAVSRHLRVLREAGLVEDEVRGRGREYRLELAALSPLRDFMTELTHAATAWERRLDALQTEVHRTKRRTAGRSLRSNQKRKASA